jgi:hypothetical protein
MAREHSPRLRGSQNQTGGSVLWHGMLVGLGRSEFAGRLAERLRSRVAWPEVLTASRRWRVAPLLYAGLRTAAAGALPPTVLEPLRRAALAHGARSVCLEQAAASAIEAASGKGIPILLLKGPALQRLVYPAGIARPMDDLDLLVAPADGPRFGDLLRRRGYRNDLRGEEDFFAPDLTHSIDLHTSLLNTTRLPARGALWPQTFETSWRRRQPLTLAGVPAWTLGPQDSLQYLAVHAVHHHGMQGIRWMADFLAVLQAWPPSPQDYLQSPAAVRRSVWYCLDRLAAQGVDPVPETRAALRPRYLLPGERRILARAGHGEGAGHLRYGLTFACLPGWPARAAFARQLLFPADGVFTAGFSDGGCPPRHTWMAHWRQMARLAVGHAEPTRVTTKEDGGGARRPWKNRRGSEGQQTLDPNDGILYHPPPEQAAWEVDR